MVAELSTSSDHWSKAYLSEGSPSGLRWWLSSDIWDMPLRSEKLVPLDRDVDGRLELRSPSGLDSAELVGSQASYLR